MPVRASSAATIMRVRTTKWLNHNFRMTLQLQLRGPKCWHLSSVHSLDWMLSCWQGTYSEYVWIQNNTDFPLPVLQLCTVGTLVLKQWTFWNEITTLPNSSSTQLLLLTLKRTLSQQLQKWADRDTISQKMGCSHALNMAKYAGVASQLWILWKEENMQELKVMHNDRGKAGF